MFRFFDRHHEIGVGQVVDRACAPQAFDAPIWPTTSFAIAFSASFEGGGDGRTFCRKIIKW
jgi:hypothetical protein